MPLSKINTNSIANTAAPNVTSVVFGDGSVTSSGWTGSKNRIINGDMRIDQRNAGASITPTDAQYSVDRWQCLQPVSGKYTAQQVSDAPAGFLSSLKFTSTSAYTSVSSDYHAFGQMIEGYNFSDMLFGTSSAATITLSFWVKSSLTGNFSVLIKDNNTFNYGSLYTINVANTWEKKTITIPGYTGGSWSGSTTNAVGLKIWFDLGAGSTYLTSANSWNSGNMIAATGGTKLIATNGATLNITGVQLEKGSTASSFEYRQYTTELQLCQRYYETGAIAFANQNVVTGSFQVAKRATPTMTRTGNAYSGSESGTFLAFGAFSFYVTTGSTYLGGIWTAAIEL